MIVLMMALQVLFIIPIARRTPQGRGYLLLSLLALISLGSVMAVGLNGPLGWAAGSLGAVTVALAMPLRWCPALAPTSEAHAG